jgi:MEDS: MEthanogen/methylotroph, DcmR Sensory domain
VGVDAFRHEAFLSADEREFVAGTADFIEDGLDAGEPALVVLPAAKIRLVRERLGARAERVDFADMAVAGRNPGRILHA